MRAQVEIELWGESNAEVDLIWRRWRLKKQPYANWWRKVPFTDALKIHRT
jgi:hypothetical protein